MVRFARDKATASSGRKQSEFSFPPETSGFLGLGNQQMAEQCRDGNEKQLKSLLPEHWNYTRVTLLSLGLVSVLFLFPVLRVAEKEVAVTVVGIHRQEQSTCPGDISPLLVKQWRSYSGLGGVKIPSREILFCQV